MNKVSRRSLANWAADQLMAGKSAKAVAAHLAAVLKQQNMAGQASFLISDIQWELEQRDKLAVAKITSASQLSSQLEKVLDSQIKKATGVHEVLLEKQIDKSVLGGIRVETSSHVWDTTLARKLTEIKEVF